MPASFGRTSDMGSPWEYWVPSPFFGLWHENSGPGTNPASTSAGSRTLLVLRLEHRQTHLPALHRVPVGTVKASGRMGSFRDRRARWRRLWPAHGSDRRHLRVSGPATVFVVRAHGLSGIDSGQHRDLRHRVPGR